MRFERLKFSGVSGKYLVLRSGFVSNVDTCVFVIYTRFVRCGWLLRHIKDIGMELC
jgi:hypothetical protein